MGPQVPFRWLLYSTSLGKHVTDGIGLGEASVCLNIFILNTRVCIGKLVQSRDKRRSQGASQLKSHFSDRTLESRTDL